MPNVAQKKQFPAAQREPQPPASEPLFRPEVAAELRTQWLGAVLLQPRISSTVFVVAATLAAIAVLALVFFGSFTRKARVNGWLVPQHGVARIFTPQPGVVTQLQVSEGTKVTKGAPLVTLSGEVQSEALGATRGEVVRRLVDRRNSLITAMDIQRHLLDQQAAELIQRLSILNRERGFFTSELELVRNQVRTAESALTRERMSGAAFNATHVQSSTYRNHSDLDARLQALERNRTTHERAILELQGTLRVFPLRRQDQLAEIGRSLAALEQELAEAEARRQIVITAPHDGTVTGIQTEPGGNTNPTVPLMSIVPTDSALEAHLFSTSRAIGFVRPGQRVLLRYQAFPYQQFGLYEGVIKSVSRSAVSPSELSHQLTGLTSMFGANEPVYRVTVDLAQQTAMAYGKAVPLQPGMQVEADVMIETRSLIEWVLDPLYSLTGKLQ
jgi:membrane fusion protein